MRKASFSLLFLVEMLKTNDWNLLALLIYSLLALRWPREGSDEYWSSRVDFSSGLVFPYRLHTGLRPLSGELTRGEEGAESAWESSANQSKSSFVLPLRKELLVSSSATSKERSRSSRYPSRRALRDKRASGIGSSWRVTLAFVRSHSFFRHWVKTRRRLFFR